MDPLLQYSGPKHTKNSKQICAKYKISLLFRVCIHNKLRSFYFRNVYTIHVIFGRRQICLRSAI